MRWWSNARARLAAWGRAAWQRIRFTLVGERGVRLGWKLLLACAVYILWTRGASWLMGVGFAALLEKWNLNADTIARAPGWARFFASQLDSIASILLSLGTITLAGLLLRQFSGKRAGKIRFKAFGGGALFGGAAALIMAGLVLLADSMRLYSSKPDLNAQLLVMLPVFFFSAWAQEWFARSLAIGTIGDRVPQWAARLLATLFFLIIADGFAYAPLGLLNMALTGLFCLLLHEKYGAGASMGFSFAWSYCLSVLTAFPGGTAASRPLFRLYSVSERFLTGGEEGFIHGFLPTLILLGGVLWLERPWRGKRALPGFQKAGNRKPLA